MADIAAADVTYAVTKQRKEESGNKINSVTITYGNSSLTYPSGGIPLTKASMGCPNAITAAHIEAANSADGIIYKYDKVNNKIRMYRGAGFTPAGTNAVSAGTINTPTFTGTSPLGDLNLATPAFSGTGLTAAGQALTTTDNQTMTLNQCAGMWLMAATATTPPMLIVSNTAVTGAPAVLTVIGAAATDAGAYKIVKDLTPVGTNQALTFTGSASTFTGTAVAETNLNELDSGSTAVVASTLYMEVIGW